MCIYCKYIVASYHDVLTANVNFLPVHLLGACSLFRECFFFNFELFSDRSRTPFCLLYAIKPSPFVRIRNILSRSIIYQMNCQPNMHQYELQKTQVYQISFFFIKLERDSGERSSTAGRKCSHCFSWMVSSIAKLLSSLYFDFRAWRLLNAVGCCSDQSSVSPRRLCDVLFLK